MAGDVFVAGVGMLKFGRYKDKDVPELGGEAALLALDDAGLTMRDPVATTKDTLAWWRGLPEQRTPESRARTLRGGLPEAKEQEVLAAWAKRDEK